MSDEPTIFNKITEVSIRMNGDYLRELADRMDAQYLNAKGGQSTCVDTVVCYKEGVKIKFCFDQCYYQNSRKVIQE